MECIVAFYVLRRAENFPSHPLLMMSSSTAPSGRARHRTVVGEASSEAHMDDRHVLMTNQILMTGSSDLQLKTSASW